MQRYLGYVRSSTDDQKLTIEAQNEDIESYVSSVEGKLVVIEGDPGVKGATAIEKCQGLMRLIEQLQPGDIVVVAKRDRLSRKITKQFAFEEMLEERQATIYSLDGVGNGEDDANWAMRVMAALFAEWEARQIRKRTKRAADQMISNGQRWGQIPYGKRLCADGRTLKDHSGQLAVIERMVTLRDAGASFREIANRLNSENIPPAGNGQWQHSSVRSILQRAESDETSDVKS